MHQILSSRVRATVLLMGSASAGALAFFSAPVAHAQITSGNIAGVVKDVTGAVVPNASVTVKSEETGVAVTVKATGSGTYLVENLLPGRYDIVANAVGFQPTTIKGATVQLNATATSDVTLSIGSSSTVVEVSSADAGLVLDTTTQNLTQTFEAAELATLPVAAIGEGVLNTSLLSPGVGSTGGIGIGVGPSIAGQRPRNNNFTIEGIDNNNKAVTGPLVYVPNDAVGEFTLITTQFSPEFGHSSGGQFNTNIISGTNKFHGKLYEYFRNRNLDAATVVNGTRVPNPRYDNNRYGGELGGPIFKNKLFFFGNYERQTIGQNTAYNVCAPTTAGIAAIRAFSGVPGFSATNIAQYLKYTPTATLADSTVCGAPSLTITSGAADTTTGNQTGATLATIPLGSFPVSSPYFTNQDALTVGVDYTISDKDSFRGRYIYNTVGSEDTAANLPAFWTTTPYKYHLIALSEFHNFTPNLINEIRIGFNRFDNTIGAGNFSYPGLDSFPNLQFYDQGFISLGPDGNAPQFTLQNLYQLTDNVSYIKGKHTLKFGFDGRKYISPQGFTQRARGDYEWSYLSDFLHDYAGDINALNERSTGNNTYYGDQTALYGYGNDTFRATEHLTLNIGLRYEFTSVPVGERAQALNSVANVPGLITFTAPQPSYTSLAPRIGIEYAPDTKTSVRVGYGIAYDVLFDNLGTLSFPPQYSATQDVGSGALCANKKICPDYGSTNFLANGGLPPASGSGVSVLSRSDAISLTSAYLPNQVVPYSENYTLTIQREVAHGLNAEIGYIGNRGVHLPAQDRINIQPTSTAANFLPTYVNGVAIAGKGTNATTLAAINATKNGNVVAAYRTLPDGSQGFLNPITSYQPFSGSNYNGLIGNLQGRTHGVQLNLSYTWSKALDNATAEVFATTLTPRRPENPQNLNADYSRSALDHTHRVTFEADYNFQPFKGGNWVMRNLVGNWNVSPIFTYESPEYATALSGTNALGTNDSTYVQRTIINPNGVKGTSSLVCPVMAGTNVVGYSTAAQPGCDPSIVAGLNPNAQYIQAGNGTQPNASRNTLAGRPTDNLDLSAYKRFTAFERYTFEFGAQAFNVLNHAQYLPGSVDDVNAYSYTGLNYTTVGTSTFNHPELIFGNNPRVLQLSGKFMF